MWSDVLTQLNVILNWDFVKGALVFFVSMACAGIAVSTLRSALHR
jgi:hypothetical protein